jgi:hypothetical protein
LPLIPVHVDAYGYADVLRGGRYIGSENLFDSHLSVPLKIRAVAIAICLVVQYIHMNAVLYPVSD